jgi:hypothetical protein
MVLAELPISVLFQDDGARISWPKRGFPGDIE